MKDDAFVVQRFVCVLANVFDFTRAQSTEILNRFRCYICVQLEHDTSGWQTAQRYIKICSLAHFRSSPSRIAGIAFIAFIGNHRHNVLNAENQTRTKLQKN